VNQITAMVAALTPQARQSLRRELDRQDPPAGSDAAAIIGAAVRLPGGVTTMGDLWELLAKCGDVVTRVPEGRWPSHRDGSANACDWGAFIDDVAGFDALHFGISPYEAKRMDPQQRHLLEVTAEAIAHAGLGEKSLRGSKTGVYMGLSSNDYLTVGSKLDQPIDAYTATGNPHSVAVGRVSYHFDLHGPCMAIDTACSSSLVALDAAVHGLRGRQCDLALTGGVHLMLDPHSTTALGAWSMLSPEGKLKAFDARADGFVRGEGCVVLVLKRLKEAERDGDRIMAVIINSAVNQDGRSNGLTAPNQNSQIAVMRDALSHTDIDPTEVAFVETHGTGTPLGDPIEFGALSEVYGSGAEPCYLGAIKTNMGHLEAAAGAASVAKSVLCLQHGQIPANLHFRSWNPAMEPQGTRLTVPSALTPLSGHGMRTVGAVSAFGFGGTNAHMLLKTHSPGPWPSVWVFPGQGGQFEGMGRRFMLEDADFATAIDELDPLFQAIADFSLHEVLDGTTALSTMATAQPAIFGFQVAAAAMLEAAQGPPTAVIGHSMGEVAAAVVAGILTREQGIRIIVERSRLLNTLPPGGAMAVVRCNGDDARRWMGSGTSLEIAALNGPAETVVAGLSEEIDDLAERCSSGHGPAVSIIRVDVASHSQFVEPVLARLRERLADLGDTGSARCPAFSTCSLGDDWGTEHWVANLRETVAFSDAMERALAEGATRFTEVSPHPVVQESMQQIAGRKATVRAVQVRPPRWNHKRFWYDAPAASAVPRQRSLFDAHVTMPDGEHLFQGDIGSGHHPWITEHSLFGTPVTPGAVLLELCATAAATGLGKVDVRDVKLLEMLPVEEKVTVTAHVRPDNRTIKVVTAADGSSTTHTTARIDGMTDGRRPVPLQISDDEAVPRAVSPEELLTRARRSGQEYGPNFQLLGETFDHGEGWLTGSLHRAIDDSPGHMFDPRALDAALLMMTAALPESALDGVVVPVAVDRLFVQTPRATVVRAIGYGRQTGRDWLIDLDLWAEDAAEPAISIRGLRAQPLGREKAPFSWANALYEVAWVPETFSDETVSGHPEIRVLDTTEASQQVAQRLKDGHVTNDAVHLILVTNSGAEGGPEGAARQLVEAVAAMVADKTTQNLVTIVTLGDHDDAAARTARALVRCAKLEVPGLPLRTISAPTPSDALDTALARAWSGDSLRLTGDGPLMATCVRVPPPQTVDGRITRPDGAYLVTGGMGGLGLRVAEALHHEGAGCVILNGRSRPEQGMSTDFDDFLADDRVEIVLGDIADEDTASRCRTVANERQLALRGVIHAAGVVADQTLATLDIAAVDQMWRPKVVGARRIDEVTVNDPLDFFVVFSTAGTVLGSPGQAGYATANAAMEGVISDRRGRRLPGTIVQWGRWGEVGLAAGARDRMMDPIPPDKGLAILRRLVAADRPETVAARLNEPVLLANFPQIMTNPFYQALVIGGETHDTISPEVLRAMPRAKALTEIHNGVTRVVAQLMGYEDSEIPRDRPLTTLGIDSLLVLRIIQGIKRIFNVKLGVASLLQGATTADLTQQIAEEILLDASPTKKPPTLGVEIAEVRAKNRAARLNRLRRRNDRDQ